MPPQEGQDVADDAATTTAVWAGGDHAEHSAKSLLGDAPLSAALHADHGRTSRLGAAPLAGVAHILFFNFDRLLAPRATSESVSCTCISRSNPRCARGWPRLLAATATERAAEDVVEHREDVANVHVREIVLSADALMAELIVPPALFVVGEHLVGLGALLEVDFRLGFVAVGTVGVKLHRQPAIESA